MGEVLALSGSDIADADRDAAPAEETGAPTSTRSIPIRKIVLPALVLLTVLAGWQYVTATGRISPIILASPAAIIGSFSTAGLDILSNAGITLTEALTGFAIGNLAGLLVAIVFVHSDLARRTIYPIAIGAEAIPFVAVIPVLILWLGNGMEPKIFITSFLSFFPMLINGFRGLRSADAEVNELLYTLSASRAQRLVMVRLPASVPFVFAALKLSACACVVAAIVAEWLAADRGLGHLIVLYGTMYRIPDVWAAALVGTVMSLCVYGAVVLAERLATPWRAASAISIRIKDHALTIAKLIVENALLITLAPGRDKAFRGWFSVDDLGRIERLEPGDVPAGIEAEDRLDVGGAFVAPGFISAHSHLSTSGSRGLGIDVPLYGWGQQMTQYTRHCDARRHLLGGAARRARLPQQRHHHRL